MLIEKLILNEKNPRTISVDKLEKLKKSILEFPKMLELRPIIINEDFVVIGGNMRLTALMQLGYKEIPNEWVKVGTLNDEQQKRFIIADNVGYGEWDWDDLSSNWNADDLLNWGLDLPETSIIEDLIAEEDDYELPEGGIETDIVIGDLFEIGEHRLLCGDSTDSDAVARLMNGEKAELLLTDPPYGIDYGGMLKGKGDGKGGADKNGWKSYDAPTWDKSKPESGVLQYFCQITDNQIIWGGNYFTDDLAPTMGWLIWDKGQRGFSLADGEMAWTSFNNALRIKEYARAKANQEEKNHPTQKPQEIIQWCFEYADRHTKIEIKLVFDPYLGSGSTMVAAHQLKRRCYGMDLEPKYCQVIIDRMRKLDSTIIIKRNGLNYERKKETAD
jgi:site-specific DNA-methyltransferase (adenine-specific)